MEGRKSNDFIISKNKRSLKNKLMDTRHTAQRLRAQAVLAEVLATVWWLQPSVMRWDIHFWQEEKRGKVHCKQNK